MIKIKRVYENKKREDGYRILVDRLWPRGIKKEDLIFDEWPKEITPSPEIRKKFAHKAENFSEFKKEYRSELRQKETHQKILALAKKALQSNVTLLYAAHDEKINHALILKEEIERVKKELS